MTFPYLNCVFDLYGTLADIHTDEEEPGLWADFSRLLRSRYGLVLPAEELRTAFRRLCSEESERCRMRLAREGVPGPEEIDILSVWQALGIPSREQAMEVSLWFRRRSTRRLRLFDGARETLDGLRRAGCRVWLLTNAQESFTLPELASLGLLDTFDHILISSVCGVRKPSPDFFGRLLAGGGRSDDFLMVGNDDRCDCHGASCAGIDCLYIATEQSPPRTAPLPANCREITTLYEILSLTEKLSRN